MKSSLSFLAVILLGLSTLTAQPQIQAHKIDSHLLRLIQESPDSYHQAYLLLKDRVDIVQLEKDLNQTRANRETRSMEVITRLQVKAAKTQGAIIHDLQKLENIDQTSVHPLWITNAIFASMQSEAIAKLSHDPRIEWIGWNAPVELEAYRDEPYSSPKKSPGGIEPGLAAINAPAMWKMGYTGYGKAVLSVDTGVDPTHPAIHQQYRGLYVPGAEAWYDHLTGTTFPFV
ncbi:MAG: hypothetical protein KDD63_19855, partial [Bacteroidetes bacterium]|nr:hypothetical protein [Bacteroidota bacterium]